MNALDLLRTVAGSDDPADRSHHTARTSLDYDALESRELLSTVQGTTSTTTTEPQALGATAGAAETGAIAGQTAGGGSVVTHAVGDVNDLQSQVPINDLLSNLSQVTADVNSTVTSITAASGLTSLPITPLLAPTVTSNETPLNNGTNDLGTVWITPPPLPPGLFHTAITDNPQFASTWMQTVNPQGGPPTFTHFGQNANGSLNGATINQPVAVGPEGPSITEEVEPVQPPSVEAHQPAGPPVQVQQDETTPQPNAQTPPGGQQGAGQLGTPGQGSAPGQPGDAAQGQQRSAGGETTQGVPQATPHVPGTPGPQGGGNQGQMGGAQGAAGAASQGQVGTGAGSPGAQGSPGGGATGGASGGSGGGGGSGAFLIGPDSDAIGGPEDRALELIDQAIPELVADSPHHADDVEAASPLPAVFGAAAVAVGGYHLALRNARVLGREPAAGPPEAAGRGLPGDSKADPNAN